jgi:uncharacterized NAD(P)/FAD-binding protein YdhS
MTTASDFDAAVREALSEVEDADGYWAAMLRLQRDDPEEVWGLLAPLSS